MRIALTILLILSYLAGTCGNGDEPAGARGAGMAYARLNYSDIWSIYYNQAGLARLEGPSAGAFFENKFFVKELGRGGFAASHPLGQGNIGLSYTSFGYAAYRESKMGLAYGMRLTENLSIGTQINYHHTRINAEDYGETGTVTAELGLMLDLSEKVSVAAHVFNLTRSELNEDFDERLPTLIRFGLNYSINKELRISGEVEKDIDFDEIFKMGIEYQPVESVFIRVGASNNPGIFAFGLGINWGAFQFDLASTYHTVLGYSPQASLTFVSTRK